MTQLLVHERIETTLPRAKELRRLADHVITISKEVLAYKLSNGTIPGNTFRNWMASQSLKLYIFLQKAFLAHIKKS